jgi:MoaA/NifB/PqqE/SkfB family radical SAM enzyme
MIEYKDIRDVHLEISTLCNASCPWCPRNFWGYPYNGGYPELYLTLDQSKKIFTKEFLNQLDSIRINGNYGDIVMNPEGADITEWFRGSNPSLKITISTNGGARDQKFWKKLAQQGAHVGFALDGMEDTHHLYRQNTVYATVLKNAKIFIDAGGHAIWQMICFDHNKHQIDACKAMSQDLGFRQFCLVDDGRDTAPVFDRHGRLRHVLGDYQGETKFKVLFHKKKTDQVLLEDIVTDRVIKSKITCETKKLKSIYIAANGDVSPCCYTGFYPKTYGHGQYHQAANAQLSPLMVKNNALEYTLEECIKWFTDVEESWKIDSYSQGRLVICDDKCGT